jgi:hypothetical protein
MFKFIALAYVVGLVWLAWEIYHAPEFKDGKFYPRKGW